MLVTDKIRNLEIKRSRLVASRAFSVEKARKKKTDRQAAAIARVNGYNATTAVELASELEESWDKMIAYVDKQLACLKQINEAPNATTSQPAY